MNNLKKKRITYKSANIIMIIAFIAILIILNIFIADANWKVDLTESGIYSLSAETIEYIKTIDKDLTIYILAKENSGYADISQIEKVAKLYEKYNPKIKVKNVDPDKNPGLVNKYIENDRKLVVGSIIVDDGEKWQSINKTGLFEADATGNVVSKVERKISSTLSFMDKGERKAIYLLTGHGEKNINNIDYICEHLKELFYDVEELDLFTGNNVPEDMYALAIIGPTNDISIAEKEKIQTYLENGGNLVVSIDPNIKIPNFENIKSLLSLYNISIDDNYIYDPNPKNSMADGPIYLFPTIQDNEITQEFVAENIYVFMPEVRSVSVIDDENEDIEVISLAKTSQDAWGETDWTNKPEKGENDKPGPLDVALAAKKEVGEKSSKVVVFGNSVFLESSLIQQCGAIGNRELFVSSLKWMGGESELLDIAPKTIKLVAYTATAEQVAMAERIVVIIPCILIAVGVFVWYRRRN